ncbi:MAG: NADH:ubiquinone reductase (Na(+)-transporting) subunit A, partial [Bacteroidota bacterium]|nr:NADH:ubiquinone reductase (Na(+)-transporting) subunit A [Bacteroidota bacterium]MDX5430576.1 NADH:ubiquinone reductase (Na(+)-transporting) subunit A [Bacteroidota bacterium]MDX5469328.1 NADH:ubiquinone reductase (Na(+)-transporting) subunit A [Bacteroidota bacterium]
MANQIRLKKGYDIKLVGEAAKEIVSLEAPKTYAVQPADIRGLVPKLQVEVGSKVKAGSPLFISKTQPDVCFTSPVSGEVVEVVRGEKRRILELRIQADGSADQENFGAADPASLGREGVKEKMLKSGMWTFLRQRPYNRVAETHVVPKNIFISGFDSAPMAPDLNFALKGRESHLQAGINALATLTDGQVYLGLRNKAENGTLESLKNVSITYFSGPHPAGNVGIQIHHVAPINKGDVVWTMNIQDVANLGKLFTEGVYDTERVVAITGSEIENPVYTKMKVGASISGIASKIKTENVRVISGNVLFGTKTSVEGYLGYFDQQITVIPEGDEPEFFGWVLRSEARPSLSKSFLSYITPN